MMDISLIVVFVSLFLSPRVVCEMHAEAGNVFSTSRGLFTVSKTVLTYKVLSVSVSLCSVFKRRPYKHDFVTSQLVWKLELGNKMIIIIVI